VLIGDKYLGGSYDIDFCVVDLTSLVHVRQLGVLRVDTDHDPVTAFKLKVYRAQVRNDVCVHAYTFVSMHMFVCECVYACLYVYTYKGACVCLYTHVHTDRHRHI